VFRRKVGRRGRQSRVIRRVAGLAATALAVGVAAASPAFALAPDAPTAVTASPGLANATDGVLWVSFVAGADNGSPITSYSVVCTSANGGVTGGATGTTSPIAITHASTALTYVCTVSATNGDGTSSATPSGTVIVGSPAPPHILRLLPFDRGLAMPFTAGANNGSAILNYRARCTSLDGGVPASPLQIVSPLVAPALTNGATYTCLVNANNARGAGPTETVGPVEVNPPGTPTWASCRGTTGVVTITPGIVLSTPKTRTITLNSRLATCTGPYVANGNISFSMHSALPVTCQTPAHLTVNGAGTITWTAPAGMGTANAEMHFVVTSTSGHVTHVHITGVVKSKSNLFTERTFAGDITLNRGLHATASGGDCTVTIGLHTMSVTAITFAIS
jgi:hypothetical protein